MSVLELVERQIAEVVQPLRDQRSQLDAEIERTEAMLADLRSARRQLQAVLKTIDPEAPKEKPKSQKTRPNLPGLEKMAALTEWLQAHSEELNGGEGFYASGLDRDYNGSLPVKGNSSISSALHVLHEQGVVRLISTGTGGARYYEVVT